MNVVCIQKNYSKHVSVVRTDLNAQVCLDHAEKKEICGEMKSAWPGLQVFVMGSSLILQHMGERKQQSYSQTCNKPFICLRKSGMSFCLSRLAEMHLK